MSYIMINDEAFACDTDKEISHARQALADAGQDEAIIYAGDVDGLDSYPTANKLFAAKPTLTYKITFADGVNVTDVMQGIAHTAQAVDHNNNDTFGWIKIERDNVDFVDSMLNADDRVASYKEVE